MARGGMYDQLGGGFARYSVDAHWLVPHFEKMLYDNAQLASLYLHALAGVRRSRVPPRVRGDARLRAARHDRPGRRLLLRRGRRLRGPRGQVLRLDAGRDPRGARRRRRPGAGVLGRRPRARTSRARASCIVAGEPDPERHRAARAGGCCEAREHRVRPGRDDKVLAAWNGLACRALAEAGRALGRADYVAAAVRNAEFLLGAMRVDGRLHAHVEGRPGAAQGLPRGLRHGRRRAARRLRGDVRAALARRGAQPRRRHAAAVLGRRAGGLLRHGRATTSA